MPATMAALHVIQTSIALPVRMVIIYPIKAVAINVIKAALHVIHFSIALSVALVTTQPSGFAINVIKAALHVLITCDCTICSTGYYLAYGFCYQCQTDCSTCTYYFNCTNCKTGQYLTDDGRCFSCPLNCIECSNGYSCDVCYSDYIYSDQYSSCVSRPCYQPHCSYCSNQSNQSNQSQNLGCLSCISGYYLSQKKQCLLCLKNCISCPNSYSCDECAQGYTWGIDQDYVENCSKQKSSALLIAIIVLPIIVLLIGISSYCYVRSNNKCCFRAQEPPVPRIEPARYRVEPVGDRLRPVFRVELDEDIIMPIQQAQSYISIKQNHQLCSVCLDSNNQIETNCKHLFHVKCILQWYKKKRTCPVCRENVRHLKLICVRCHKKYKTLSLQGASRGIRNKKCRQCALAEGK